MGLQISGDDGMVRENTTIGIPVDAIFKMVACHEELAAEQRPGVTTGRCSISPHILKGTFRKIIFSSPSSNGQGSTTGVLLVLSRGPLRPLDLS